MIFSISILDHSNKHKIEKLNEELSNVTPGGGMMQT
jgi:lactoylglutathione lyase